MSNKPIRAKTPYNFFYQEVFQEIYDDMMVVDSSSDDMAPVGSYTPIFLEIARQWQAMDAHDKVHYETLAALDKRRYLHEMAAWHQRHCSSSSWHDDDDVFRKP